MADRAKRVLYCHCAYFDIVPVETRRRVLAALQAGPVALTTVRDLCALAADEDPLLRKLAGEEELVVVACYGRAVRALFDTAGAALDEKRVTFLNMRARSPEQILAALGLPDGGESADVTHLGPVGSWLPWFPVMDAQRCTNCKQCLNFCLFGVYEADADGTVRVESPDQCKTNCPACARVCPAAAIIFPKYASGPICGDDSPEADQAGEPVSVDVSELMAGDVYQMLRKRGAAADVTEAELAEHIHKRLGESPGEQSPDGCEVECPRCPEKS